ncbi:MAG: SDR family oxidoreductase [Lachnospiraceae bacterium]|jgi:nucleoside-diphosphate-sugar epimerase|nr:SDR family oxidoreductase [Lachnospiraceae bacterium]
MKILFIGGTGTISMAVSKLLLSQGHTLYLLNRGNRNLSLSGDLVELKADVNDESRVKELIKELHFDAVADFIAFEPPQLERDYRLFKGKTDQFIFISSASAYQKPLADYRINEGTPLANPYLEYSRNKIACEDYLMKLYREEGFPVTIIRPSHTYDERSVPMGAHGKNGSYAIVKRMLEGKPVLIHGDGTSLWTLTHNSDFAVAMAGLIGNIHAIGEAVQITSDESLTWNQIYQIVANALGVKLNAVHASTEFLDACGEYDFRGSLLGDKSNTMVFDNSKLKRLVPGFTARVRADQGIRDTVSYVLSHPECQVEDSDFDAWCDRVVEALDRAVEMVRKA